MTGGRSNQMKQQENTFIRADRDKVFNQSWSEEF